MTHSRILIVQPPEYRDDLIQAFLKPRLPQSQAFSTVFDTASTPDMGAKQAGHGIHDLVIAVADPDKSLDALCQASRLIPVIHVVEPGTSEQFSSHFLQAHNGGPAACIMKSDPAWGETVARQARQIIYSKFVMDELRRGPNRLSATDHLRNLVFLLDQSWADLSPHTQETVQKVFNVSGSPDNPRFTLKAMDNLSAQLQPRMA